MTILPEHIYLLHFLIKMSFAWLVIRLRSMALTSPTGAVPGTYTTLLVLTAMALLAPPLLAPPLLAPPLLAPPLPSRYWGQAPCLLGAVASTLSCQQVLKEGGHSGGPGWFPGDLDSLTVCWWFK